MLGMMIFVVGFRPFSWDYILPIHEETAYLLLRSKKAQGSDDPAVRDDLLALTYMIRQKSSTGAFIISHDRNWRDGVTVENDGGPCFLWAVKFCWYDPHYGGGISICRLIQIDDGRSCIYQCLACPAKP